MSNIEKKLDALIDALGFDVEAISKTYINGNEVDYKTPAGVIHVDPDDDVLHTTDYKLTKRIDIDQLVKNIINLSHLDEDLRFIKCDEYDFDRVIGWFGALGKRVGSGCYLILGVEVLLDA